MHETSPLFLAGQDVPGRFMGGISMRNKPGVVLHLRAVSEEGLLQLGRSGMTVKLRK